MNEPKFALHDPIAALATPWLKSALAVIRTSGAGSVALLDRLFTGGRPLAERAGYTLAHGFLVDPVGGEKIDEVLAAVFHSPHSYTGEEAVELTLHGGLPTVARALSLLHAHGFRDAAPGEFSLRAFRNGKMDLCAAEAVNDIVNAQSDRARALALSRLGGALRSRIEGVKQELVAVLAGIEVMIDYPDESYEHAPLSRQRLREAEARLEALLATFQAGRIIKEGVAAAVVGRTNSGKSTLFNLLLKEDRSIVSPTPGTTRDFIEGGITVNDVPIRLFDTAGFRDTRDGLEEEGIRRTRRVLEGAALILYLVDATAGLTEADEVFLKSEACDRPLIKIWNKIDLAGAPPPPGFLPLCAVSGRGLSDLEEAVGRALLGVSPPDAQGPVIDSYRHKEALERARSALSRAGEGLEQEGSYDLIAADLREAVDALGEITGEVTSGEILDTVFSKFCVGK